LGLVEDDLAAARFKRKWHMNQRIKASSYRGLHLRLHKQQQEATAAGAEQFAAQGPGRQGFFVNAVDLAVADRVAEVALSHPGFVQQRAKLADVGIAGEQG